MSWAISFPLLVAVSLVCEAIVCVYCSRGFSFLMALLIPFIASASLYWLPHLDKIHDAETRGWFVFFLVFWFVPSAAACLIEAFIMTSLRGRTARKKNESI